MKPPLTRASRRWFRFWVLAGSAKTREQAMQISGIDAGGYGQQGWYSFEGDWRNSQQKGEITAGGMPRNEKIYCIACKRET